MMKDSMVNKIKGLLKVFKFQNGYPYVYTSFYNHKVVCKCMHLCVLDLYLKVHLSTMIFSVGLLCAYNVAQNSFFSILYMEKF